MIQKISILGSTGSVGRQCVEVISHYKSSFEIVLLHAHKNIDLLYEQCLLLQPKYICVTDELYFEKALDRFGLENPKLILGSKALFNFIETEKIDLAIHAIHGFDGLLYTLKFIDAKINLALANKESLVAAGEQVMLRAKRQNVKIIPLDSEHWALSILLKDIKQHEILKVVLPASGGPFWKLPRSMWPQISKQDVLNHPVWNMGAGITVNSANMLNTVFEIIEAYHLFDLSFDQINIQIHPSANYHALVYTKDQTIHYLEADPNMKVPIMNILGLKDLFKVSSLNQQNWAELSDQFYQPDFERFPLAYKSKMLIQRKGNLPCMLNAANEVAVEAFLQEKIKFVNIDSVIEQTLENMSYIENPSLEDILASHEKATQYANSLLP